MGRKSRAKKKQGKDWVKASPDEVVSRGPLRIERYGRYIQFSNILTPEEHTNLLEHFEEVNRKMVEDLEEEVPLLQSLVAKYSDVEPLCIERLICCCRFL